MHICMTTDNGSRGQSRFQQALVVILDDFGMPLQILDCAIPFLEERNDTFLNVHGVSSVSGFPYFASHHQIEIQRGLTTSSVAIFVPFTTQELFQNGSEALYYGINALSNNLIMVDRKLLKNPNGLILGTPGSGKSFSAKREITNAFLICPKDDIIICDPEGEYTPLVERLHGQVIKLSPTGKGYDGSPCYINPMDLNLDYSDDDNPLSLKSDFILSLCELIVGGKDGLAPVEKTIIDRCVRIVYRDYG